MGTGPKETPTVDTSRKLTPLQLHRKVELMRRGVTAADIARQVGMSRASVSLVLLDRMRNEKIEEAIAAVLMEPVDLLFPPKRTLAA
jgi:transcriptional regulator with XRE-family HTH domain